MNLGFMIFGTLLGSATSWYLYKLTMRYVEEAAHEIGGDVDLDLEEGLLGEVDELLDGERGGGRRGSVRLPEEGDGGVEALSWEGDGDFSDFEEEESEEESARGKIQKGEGELVDLSSSSSRRTSEDRGGGGVNKGDQRRDSVAWGLDLSDQEEDFEEDEVSIMDRSGLEAGLESLRNDAGLRGSTQDVTRPKKRID